jgi:hypothetical protein
MNSFELAQLLFALFLTVQCAVPAKGFIRPDTAGGDPDLARRHEATP